MSGASHLPKDLRSMAMPELRRYAAKLAADHLRSLDWEQFWGADAVAILWADDALAQRATQVKREIETRLEKVR